MHTKKILVSFIIASGVLATVPAFPIGKTGNNCLYDSRDKLLVKIPGNYPYTNNINQSSVILRSSTIIRNQQGFLDQASFRAFSFRDVYQNLLNHSLGEVKNYFLQISKVKYQVIYETSDRLVLLGQNDESAIGIVIGPEDRGVVFEGIRNEVIKQGILDTMNGVVFQ